MVDERVSKVLARDIVYEAGWHESIVVMVAALNCQLLANGKTTGL